MAYLLGEVLERVLHGLGDGALMVTQDGYLAVRLVVRQHLTRFSHGRGVSIDTPVRSSENGVSTIHRVAN